MIRLTAVIEVEGHAPRALTHESNARSIVLGRDETADFQLPLTTISRHHARIDEVDGVYTIEDLGSTHGTQVDGVRLIAGDKKVLRNGDIIEMTRAKVTIAIEQEKVVSAEPGEGTQAIAARAVQGILGRLGDMQSDGPYLRVLGGVDEGKRFALTGPQGEWTLGRSRDSDCMLSDTNVSRRHATIKKDWDGFRVFDLGSKNGVLVGGIAITRPRRLRDRDEITVGPVKLVFVDPDADLLDALKDVPGFAREDSVPDVVPAQTAGAPSAPGEAGKPADPSQGIAGLAGLDDALSVGAAASPDRAASDDDIDLALIDGLDPALLASPRSKIPVDLIVMGVAGVVALGGAIVAYFVLTPPG